MKTLLDDYDFMNSGGHSLEEWANDLINLRDKYKNKDVEVFLDGDSIMIYGDEEE